MKFKTVIVLVAAFCLTQSITTFAASLEPHMEIIESEPTEEAIATEEGQEGLDIWGDDDSNEETLVEQSEETLETGEFRNDSDTEEISAEDIVDSSPTPKPASGSTNNDLPKTGISDCGTIISEAISDFCYWLFSLILK